MKRMSLAGDVISHIALPGLGLALLFRINPLIGAAATLLLGTFLIWHLQKGGTLTTDVAIGVIWRGDRVFVQRRPLEGFLGGLWEFPGGKRLRGESIRGCLARELREEIGFRGEIGPPVLTIRHAYSMYRVRLHAFVCAWRGGAPRPQAQEWRWARLDDLSALAFPAANRRLIEALRAGGVPGPPRSSRA